MGKAAEIRSGMGVRRRDDGQPMGRRDPRSRHDQVPQAHLRLLYGQRKYFHLLDAGNRDHLIQKWV